MGACSEAQGIRWYGGLHGQNSARGKFRTSPPKMRGKFRTKLKYGIFPAEKSPHGIPPPPLYVSRRETWVGGKDSGPERCLCSVLSVWVRVPGGVRVDLHWTSVCHGMGGFQGKQSLLSYPTLRHPILKTRQAGNCAINGYPNN